MLRDEGYENNLVLYLQGALDQCKQELIVCLSHINSCYKLQGEWYCFLAGHIFSLLIENLAIVVPVISMVDNIMLR